jgi:hypothetical protein
MQNVKNIFQQKNPQQKNYWGIKIKLFTFNFG